MLPLQLAMWSLDVMEDDGLPLRRRGRAVGRSVEEEGGAPPDGIVGVRRTDAGHRREGEGEGVGRWAVVRHDRCRERRAPTEAPSERMRVDKGWNIKEMLTPGTHITLES